MLYRPGPEAKISPIRRTISRYANPRREFSVGLYLSVAGTLVQNRDFIERLPQSIQGWYFLLQESPSASAAFSLYSMIGVAMMFDAGVLRREEWTPYLWAYIKVFILNTDSSSEDSGEE